MPNGQGRAYDDPRRNEELSAAQGRFYVLPLLLWRDESPRYAERLAAVERWAIADARTWQLAEDAREAPGDPAPAARLRDALARAAAAWPDFPPFLPGMPFSREALDVPPGS